VDQLHSGDGQLTLFSPGSLDVDDSLVAGRKRQLQAGVPDIASVLDIASVPVCLDIASVFHAVVHGNDQRF